MIRIRAINADEEQENAQDFIHILYYRYTKLNETIRFIR